MKNILTTLICVIIACTFINMYMNNKILETTIYLNNLHAEYNMKETTIDELEATDEKEKSSNSTQTTPSKSTNTNSATQSKTEEKTTEKSKPQLDVNTILEEVSFSDKLFLSSILIKIGGINTVNKLIDGDKETIASIKGTLSQEEIDKLNSLSKKYDYILGDYMPTI